jgi:alpha-mannosidase
VNGESRGHFPWDGDFELTNNAMPGQKFVIAIKAINTGGPLRLIRAELVSEQSKSIRQTVDDLVLSFRTGQKLLSFDTYQTNARRKEDPGIDKSSMKRNEKAELHDILQSVAGNIDVKALADGNTEKFLQSVAEQRPKLKPVGDYAKRFTLYFDANAHIDAAWLWREKETIEVCKNTFTSVFNIMNARPDFTYTQSAAAYYDWMEQHYPEVFKGIQQRVKDGRWEITGGMWVEPDCNLPGGESWMRHLLYAKKYFRKKFGVDVKIGWNPDSFGYNGNIPMFYQSAGIDAFITQKIGWNEKTVFPYRLFWWESQDGSKILSYFPFDYVNEISNPYQLVDWMRQFEANTGMTKMMVLFGVGDHGGGPSMEMIDRIERLKTLDIYPSIEYGNTATYLTWLRQQDLTKIPVWNDELYLEYHQGTYTTQAAIKELNRKSEVLLTNAEKFSAIASLYNKPYQSADLQSAWQDVLFNQFHDILPGSGIREIYIDAKDRYRSAESVGKHELTQSLTTIAGNINTSSIQEGVPVIVFNPLSWERSDLVVFTLPDKKQYEVYDQQGRRLSSQIITEDKYHQSIMFVAPNVPAMGYATFVLREEPSQLQLTQLTASLHSIGNSYFAVTLDTVTGWINSIIDKRFNKELLSGYGNELQILEDKPSAWDAWNIGLTGTKYPSRLRTIEIVEKGPVRTILRITRDYLKPGVKKDFPTEDFPSTFFTQNIMLYDGIDRIDFKTDVDWWEEKTMLKVAFPLSVQDTVATYEIPYGSIKRSTAMTSRWDSAKVEVPAQHWADISQDNYGVSLLNNSKYGYDIKGNTIRLSLLRSPKWPDPTADRGKHSIEYSLYPHRGRVEESLTVQRGYELNNPLLAVMRGNTDLVKPKLPLRQSFARLQPSNLILTTIKKAEEDNAWIVQWYNTSDATSEAQLELQKAPLRVMTTNALEENGNKVSFKEKTIRVTTGKRGITTLKIYF